MKPPVFELGYFHCFGQMTPIIYDGLDPYYDTFFQINKIDKFVIGRFKVGLKIVSPGLYL